MNTQEQGEIIKLVYVCCQGTDDRVELSAHHQGWQIIVCDALSSNLSAALGETPDFLVVDLESIDVNKTEQVLGFVSKKVKKPLAAIFGVLAVDPGVKKRCALLSMGFDDLFIKPLSIEELGLKAPVFLGKKELEQQIAWTREKLDDAVKLLEKFKADLLNTRKALVKEKNLLHNSLKQITIMTGERERLKAENLDLGGRLQKNTRGIEHILGSMIEAGNETNKGHARRVARIAKFVGDSLGLSMIEKMALKQAALLHEAGQLFIPGSVSAKKREELTEYERDLFRQAPETGAAFLSQCPGLERASQIICHLHENVDGTGRPKGLKRRYIPLAARILAGADLLDDLANGLADGPDPAERRPLPDALPGMLEPFSGTRLDPRIVNLLEYYVVTCMDGHSTRIKEMGVYQLKPGMTMGAGVYAKTGTKLFSAGAVLTQESITMLMRYNREYPLAETVFIKVD
ncbi:metal dependent response regulator [Desulforapulum autotrophicum HRM2]|uniref:Metal dependent response regulator n=1 Tax=Desulforapulum autotrophicum (strain ATCC 43914 / DSM 3382 / VKM B-1955 / HRM2) TaxID=177437 RepID=C0QAG0_DESAH|nr:HD domain-containing phosphohydrolase [Desulforapulum autotrophicum]ACN14745.1 metal dependent response regulator [Desulforapulum autotrophicum HRM2]